MDVSIIIPVYNVEKYLEECLDSAVNQTLDRVEIICINDGSIDSSLEILERYKKKYENIIIIDQDNKGLGAARNIGMKKASGKYIYFLDSDDYIELDAMEICFNECEKNTLDFITFDCNTFYEVDYNGTYTHKINRNDILDSQICTGKKLFNKMLEKNCMHYETWLNFFNKNFLNKFKIEYRENLIYEDVVSTVKSYLYAEKIKYIDRKLFNRRVRNNSIMTSEKTKKNINSHYICALELNELYKTKKASIDSITRNNLRKCIRNFYYYCITNSYVLNEYTFIKKISESIDEEIECIHLDILVNKPKLLI